MDTSNIPDWLRTRTAVSAALLPGRDAGASHSADEGFQVVARYAPQGLHATGSLLEQSGGDSPCLRVHLDDDEGPLARLAATAYSQRVLLNDVARAFALGHASFATDVLPIVQRGCRWAKAQSLWAVPFGAGLDVDLYAHRTAEGATDCVHVAIRPGLSAEGHHRCGANVYLHDAVLGHRLAQAVNEGHIDIVMLR